LSFDSWEVVAEGIMVSTLADHAVGLPHLFELEAGTNLRKDISGSTD
jgi:hypothetical protein